MDDKTAFRNIRLRFDQTLETAYLWIMTTREKIAERIANLDDAALPDLLEEITRFERRRRDVGPEFFSTLEEVYSRNDDLSEDEAMALATEAVRWARRNPER